MTATTLDDSRRAAPIARGGFRGAVAAEWTKLWTVRSTWYCLAVAFALGLFQAASLIASYNNGAMPGIGGTFPVGFAAAVGIQVGQVGLIALAMLAVTAEYSTGAIRSTLQWVPVCGRLVAAKATVVTVVTAVAGAVLAVLSCVGAWLVIGDQAVVEVGRVSIDIGAATVYAALVSVLTLGVGLVVRSAAGTLTTVFLLLFVLPNVLTRVSLDAVAWVGERLPGTAATVLLDVFEGGSQAYSRWYALAVLVAWAVAATAAGVASLSRRDA